jgi:hypothetical protein
VRWIVAGSLLHRRMHSSDNRIILQSHSCILYPRSVFYIQPQRGATYQPRASPWVHGRHHPSFPICTASVLGLDCFQGSIGTRRHSRKRADPEEEKTNMVAPAYGARRTDR